MNLDMVRPKNKTKDLLLSETKNCEMLVKQTHTKPQQTLEFNFTKPRETFSFKPSINLDLDSNWMVGLSGLEVYNPLFNITEENNKFELYTGTFDEFSIDELKDGLEEILSTSDITPSHLHHEKIGPRSIEAYKKLKSRK